MHATTTETERYHLSLRGSIRRLPLPVMDDLIVVGRQAKVDRAALGRLVRSASRVSYREVIIHDGPIAFLLVRSELMRRLTTERVVQFVREHVQPVMSAAEIIEVKLDVSVRLDADLL